MEKKKRGFVCGSSPKFSSSSWVQPGQLLHTLARGRTTVPKSIRIYVLSSNVYMHYSLIHIIKLHTDVVLSP